MAYAKETVVGDILATRVVKALGSASISPELQLSLTDICFEVTQPASTALGGGGRGMRGRQGCFCTQLSCIRFLCCGMWEGGKEEE